LRARTVAKRAHDLATRALLAPRLRFEWRNPPFAHPNERAVEYAFALRALAAVGPGTVLDVGSGTTAWPHLLSTCGFRITAIDEMRSYWKEPIFNRHYHVIQNDITKPNVKSRFDAVTCISTLEHIRDHAAAVRGMFALLRPHGYLIMTFPYSEDRYVEDVYRHPSSDVEPYAGQICRMYDRATIDGWLAEHPADIVEQRYFRAFTGRLWREGERIRPQPVEVARTEPHHLSCLLVRARG
jgi:SAM-dependent methyltransferase